MEDKILNDIAARLGKTLGVNLNDIARQIDIHPSQIIPALNREIRNGNTMGLSSAQLDILSKNIGDAALTKVIRARSATSSNFLSIEDKTSRAKHLADSLEDLHKKLYDRTVKSKPKAKLVNGKKTKIPGFSYYFRKESK